MTTTYAESILQDAEHGLVTLRNSMRDDPHILREETETNAISWLSLLGRALAHKVVDKLPEFETRLIQDIARHAGNAVLGLGGDKLKRDLANWSVNLTSSVSRNFAEDLAVSFYQDFQYQWYVQSALEAYLEATDEDDSWRERLESEADNFEIITSRYRTSLLTDANGFRALTWAATKSDYAENFLAMLPEGVTVPYYLDPQWYRDYGPA
jgi:hypothetical protein